MTVLYKQRQKSCLKKQTSETSVDGTKVKKRCWEHFCMSRSMGWIRRPFFTSAERDSRTKTVVFIIFTNDGFECVNIDHCAKQLHHMPTQSLSAEVLLPFITDQIYWSALSFWFSFIFLLVCYLHFWFKHADPTGNRPPLPLPPPLFFYQTPFPKENTEKKKEEKKEIISIYFKSHTDKISNRTAVQFPSSVGVGKQKR